MLKGDCAFPCLVQVSARNEPDGPARGFGRAPRSGVAAGMTRRRLCIQPLVRAVTGI